MPLQDLTPQLRTRLRRVERAVGLFVSVATLLLLAGFAYYLYHTAQSRGWLLVKVPYYTYVKNAAGLKVGQPVKMLGFEVGEITKVEAMPPENYYDVYVEFRVKQPYYDYLWTDSHAQIAGADFLGNRYIEVTKLDINNANHSPTFKLINNTPNVLVYHADNKDLVYKPLSDPNAKAYLTPVESGALTERLGSVASQVEAALPGILALTNQVNTVLANASRLVSNLDATVTRAQPVITNLAVITTQLRDPHGSLGEWIIPANTHRQLDTTLGSANTAMRSANAALVSANTTVASARTNLTDATVSLMHSLDNVAEITSNLNAQIQANSLMLTEISTLIVHTDEMLQGLKRSWFLKDSFPRTTNRPPASIVQPTIGGGK